MACDSSQILFAEIEKYILITFKFGGIWVEVKEQGRKRYDGGKQKSIRVDKDLFSFIVLREEFEKVCPWLVGYVYKLYYYVCGTSPKDYKLLTTDAETTEMVKQSNGRAEIVVELQNINEDSINSQDREFGVDKQIVECSPNYNDGDLSRKMIVENTLAVGSYFTDSMAFKHALRSQAILTNFGVRIIKSDKKRVIATCTYQGCEWRIRASLCVDGQTFQVRKLSGTHSCPGVNRAGNRLATTAWVANEIQDIVKKQPDIPPKQINNALEMNYGLSLPYMKIWRSREQARDNIFGYVDENYKWVPTLRAELLKRNPGSHITFTYDSVDNSFQRFYVSFKASTDGFLVGCRHLIGLDACHLKSKHLGVLLSANSLDGNNGIFTLAYAVAETESKKTWQWFLENLGKSIGLDLYPLAFISDMEKGLGEAVRQVFPKAEHRVCLRHLWKNLKKQFHCKDGHNVRNLVWAAANAYTELEYEKKISEIFDVSPLVHSYLLSLTHKWSKSQFMSEIKHDCNTNNMAESFNAWIAEARSKPVVDLIDIIRGKLMEQRAARKMGCASWRGVLVPHAEEYIREVSTRKEQFIVRQSTNFKAEVEAMYGRHEVDITTRECTCKSWQITGLPCIHAVAFIGMKEHQLWHIHVDDHYHATRYKMAYENAIATLPGREQWQLVDEGVEIGAPNTSRPRGRPRKKRLINFLEKDRNVHKCSRCGLWGHHRSTCKNALKRTYASSSRCTPSMESSRPKLAVRRDALDIRGEEVQYTTLLEHQDDLSFVQFADNM